MTTNDNEWQQVIQGVTMSGTMSDSKWQRVTMSDNEWERVTTNDTKWHRVTKSGTTNKSSTLYFKEWMIAILSITKIDTQLQGMDGW